tara:strand:- start:101 stop:409 length:309 start_codon:yes stop_codon:yes gene_type:complete
VDAAARDDGGLKSLNSFALLHGYRTELEGTDGGAILVTRMPGPFQVWCLVIYLVFAVTTLVLGNQFEMQLVGAGFVAVHWTVITGMGYAQHKYYKRLKEAYR